MNKADKFWRDLFDKYNILEKINRTGLFEITSKQINQLWESRLMTRFDQKVNLPELFQKYNLSILPKTRGKYVISDFNAYQKINYQYTDKINSDLILSASRSPKAPVPESCTLPCASFSTDSINVVMMGVPLASVMPSLTAIMQRPCFL